MSCCCEELCSKELVIVATVEEAQAHMQTMSLPPLNNGDIKLSNIEPIKGKVPRIASFNFSLEQVPEKGKKYVFGFEEADGEIFITVAIDGAKADEIAKKLKGQ